MKTIWLSLILIMFSAYTFAQGFDSLQTVKMMGAERVNAAFGDMNRDGATDVVYITGSPDNYRLIIWDRKQDRKDTLLVIPSSDDLLLTDPDRNNVVDIIILSEATGTRGLHVLKLQPDSTYSAELIRPADDILNMHAADLNQDGSVDLIYSIVSDDEIHNGYLLDIDGAWMDHELTIDKAIRRLEVIDFNGDLQPEIFALSEDGVLHILNPASNYSPMEVPLPDSLADFTVSKLHVKTGTDLIFSGKTGSAVINGSISLDSAMITYEDWNSLSSNLFSADLNSDGMGDIFFIDDTRRPVLMSGDSSGFTRTDIDFPVDSASRIIFGDIDHEGDLDVLIYNNSRISIYENTVGINKGPLPLREYGVFHLPDRIVIGWVPTFDDHTDSTLFSYDVAVGQFPGDASIVPSSFSLDDGRRMLWETGNAGHANQMILKIQEPGSYWYAIQPLDNALFPYDATCLDGEDDPFRDPRDTICQLFPSLPVACGEFEICASVTYADIYICDPENADWQTTSPAAWYSTQTGFAGFGTSPQIEYHPGDTIYSATNSCSYNRFILLPPTDIGSFSEKTVCMDSEIELRAREGADSVSWFHSDTLLSNSTAIQWKAIQPDTLIVSSFFGKCIRTDTIAVIPSRPELEVSPENASIMLGEEISLAATGADRYEWIPAGMVDDPMAATVLARPTQTTTFRVTGYDSINCKAERQILVEVRMQAFIPNLFTPNDDGNNDVLLIYGMPPTENFRLSIFSRNGTEMFSTTDAAVMSSNGWDGTRNGSGVPDGIYYWKVEGRLPDGKPLLLNGKTEGIVHLVR